MKPFKEKSFVARSFMQKLLNQHPNDNFIIEVNNIFHKAKQIDTDIKYEIDALRIKYKIKQSKAVNEKLIAIYEELLSHYFEDRKLSEQELNNLSEVKEYLDLPNNLVNSSYEKIAKEVYKKSVEEVVSDGAISEEEKAFLQNLESQLKLSDDLGAEIYSTSVQEYFSALTNSIVEDARISPEEEKQLNQIAKNLGTSLSMDEKSKYYLERFKLYWKIENEELPQVSVDINLQKNEVCFAIARSVEWYEMRSVTKRYNYAGPTARIKIAKGIYYRVGSVAVQPVKDDQLSFIDNGTLYLTNKRIIFNGNKKVTNIQLKKIIDLNEYKDGIEIVKDAGKSPVLKFNQDPDLFYLIMNRLIREN